MQRGDQGPGPWELTPKANGKKLVSQKDRLLWDLPERLQGSAARRSRSAMGTRADPAYAQCEYFRPADDETVTLEIVTKRKAMRFVEMAPRRSGSHGSTGSAFGGQTSSSALS